MGGRPSGRVIYSRRRGGLTKSDSPLTRERSTPASFYEMKEGIRWNTRSISFGIQTAVHVADLIATTETGETRPPLMSARAASSSRSAAR